MRFVTFAGATLLVAFSAPIALAQQHPADTPDSQSLSQGAKAANPENTTGGSTADPTAEPRSGSLSDKGKENTAGGSNPTTNPTGKPATSDLGSKKTNN